MKNLPRFVFLVFVIGIPWPRHAWSSTPCDGVDRSLTDERKAALSRRIGELQARKLDVLQSFQFGGWTILYVEPHTSDEEFLFYSDDPMTGRYITEWGGVAARFEEREIRRWTLKNVPGIPPKLAGCFAWHVTNDQNGWPPT
ncbi:MAG: hypothetical protein ABSG10_08425 [Terracidiphilus sp.]|jgi:hypothetical protein